MDQVQIDERLVTDIMPFVYKVTRIISPTEFVVRNTYQNTEHKVEYSNIYNIGWKFSGVDIPHQFNRVGNPISQPIISQPTPRLIPQPIISQTSSALTPQPIISQPTPVLIHHPTYGIIPQPTSGLVHDPTYGLIPPELMSLLPEAISSRPVAATPQPLRTNPLAVPINNNQPLPPEMGQRPALSYYDWLDYVYDNDLIITWDQFERLPDDTIIFPSIEQYGTGPEVGIVTPELYFQTLFTTIGDIGRDNFYEFGDHAVLGSGADNSILQSNLVRTPLINTDI